MFNSAPGSQLPTRGQAGFIRNGSDALSLELLAIPCRRSTAPSTTLNQTEPAFRLSSASPSNQPGISSTTVHLFLEGHVDRVT